MPKYCTNAYRLAGFGSMLQTLFWTIVYSYFNGYEFVYTDVNEIELLTMRNEHETDKNSTIDDVNKFMSIKSNYKNINDVDKSDVIVVDVPIVFSYIESNINKLPTCKGFLEFKTFFLQDKINNFPINTFNVAIHVRRLGKTESLYYSYDKNRYGTSLTKVLELMNQIRTQFRDKNPIFHVYSSGNDSFTELKSNDTIFHIDKNVLNTFNDMIFADILIMSTSSFSYTAALLSSSKYIYYPKGFSHPPLEHWILT
jgi:hypothetical protein